MIKSARRGDPLLGARVRELRQQRGLSLKEVAETVKYGESSISRFETGIERIPDDFLDRFCESVNISRDLFLRGDLNKGALNVAAASYSDYMFFCMVSQAPAFSVFAQEHLPPLEVDIKHVRFDQIPSMLKSGELHVSLFSQEKAFSILSQPEYAGLIVQLPALYSIQNNPLIAFAGPDGSTLKTFGQLFLQNRAKDRDFRMLSTLRQCLAQLADPNTVNICLPAKSDRSALVSKLVQIALDAKPEPLPHEETSLKQLQRAIDQPDANGPENGQLNEPAAFHQFANTAHEGKKAAVLACGLAHRIMAESWPGVGQLIGNLALQMLTNVMPGYTSYFFPQYCLLVNKHIWETRRHQLQTLSVRWNTSVEAVNNESMNYRWVNEYIDKEMIKAHELRKQWLIEAGFDSTAKDPFVNWPPGIRLFETFLRENLIQLRRWNWELS